MLAHGPQGRQGLDADRLQVEPAGGQIILPIIGHLGDFLLYGGCLWFSRQVVDHMMAHFNALVLSKNADIHTQS